MINKSYVDPAKTLWREKLREFIARNIIPYRSARDLRVACFPGAENEGEEALEVLEVYDELGIPRQNIVGLERDTENAERLRSADLGIKVEETDAKAYFLETQDNFDIISLDYMGQMKTGESDTFESIASRQLLHRNGMISTNFFAARESERMKRMNLRRILHSNNTKHPHKSEEEFKIEENRIEKTLKEARGDSLRDGITYETINIFGGGTLSKPTSRHFFSEEPSRKEAHAKMVESFLALPDEELVDIARSYGVSKSRAAEVITDLASYDQGYFIDRRAQTIDYLSRTLSGKGAEAIVEILVSDFQKSYRPKELERYEYTSNNGAKMVSDFLAFSSIPKGIVYEAMALSQIKVSNGLKHIVPNIQNYDLERYADRVSDLYHKLYNSSVKVFPRIELKPSPLEIKSSKANGTHPAPAKLSDGTKNEIYQWIRDGSISDTEICDLYGIKSRQLGSYKAHVTMKDRKSQISS